jgi:hypothetical protein
MGTDLSYSQVPNATVLTKSGPAIGHIRGEELEAGLKRYRVGQYAEILQNPNNDHRRPKVLISKYKTAMVRNSPTV